MGAETFVHHVKGKDKTPEQWFRELTEHARWEHGHGGYTGTIAEKFEFVMVPPVEDVETALLDERHPAYDKWGPAACMEVADGYVFFGWASS